MTTPPPDVPTLYWDDAPPPRRKRRLWPWIVSLVVVIVLFGGAVDENAMGYPWHENVVDRGTGSPCGKWEPCEHCAAIWERLTPQTVFDRFSQLTAKLFV